VAKKAGHSGEKAGQGIAKEINQEITQAFSEIFGEGSKAAKRKAASCSRDFAEEIHAYLADGIHDLMKEGHTEEEALKITIDKFDEAELKGDFSDFLEEFDGFGIQKNIAWYVNNAEVLGLFYGAFVMLGLTVGSFSGYLMGDGIGDVGIGAGFGLGFGITCGLLSHALLRLFRKP
jgi:hypothetical protein